MAKKKRIKIEVEVNVDENPRRGHRPDDLVEFIQRLLDQTIQHQDPQVTYMGEIGSTEDVRVAS
jgi:hypothetical protein